MYAELNEPVMRKILGRLFSAFPVPEIIISVNTQRKRSQIWKVITNKRTDIKFRRSGIKLKGLLLSNVFLKAIFSENT